MKAMMQTAGLVTQLEPGLRMILAPNPSPMTFRGTNTFILGEGDVAVIDPGPEDPAHLRAILDALRGERISHIIVTHAHLDHAPLARTLSHATGAPVLAHGDARAGRSPVMERLSRDHPLSGGEGVDTGFVPDIELPDGARIAGAGWSLRALHTPGHFGNHICLVWHDRIFTGDHVMGWASTMVSPPDGDMGAYMRSLERLTGIPSRRMYPGHGEPIEDPASRLAELIAHRRAREQAILDALARGPATARELTMRIYTDTPAALLPAAERNVLAHLIDLNERSRIRAVDPVSPAARFQIV
ncbi:hydroxyacylglutathione hydrolase [Albidovulum inexpectatum]|uniref:Hydroxyacylglutathione hydrolase n=1 Tax=Albidovulum inexpectatum TaxID=196587 RepID=A0A2S5JEK7_9RHOB|nr:MBL fold metallo-hydrolase [Albidovulum inexpectatum]PPB79829.1 hydroxyacylglutathione hydrolase [Albidovulum inexpectatum]